jgi:two-component system, cell cycle sensor histidine kinase and response regulator CckA
MPDADGHPSRQDLLDKLRILEAENQELTERSEELVLLGAIWESLPDTGDPSSLIEQVLERVGLLRGYALVAYGALGPEGFEPRLTFCPSSHAPAVRLELPRRILARPGKELPSLLVGLEAEGVLCRLEDGRCLRVEALLVLPARSPSSPDTVLVVIDEEPGGRLAGSVGALLRVADLLTMRLENLALLSRLRELAASLDAQVESRTAELQRALLELRRSEERFRRLFEGAGDGIFCVDGHGRFTDVNEQACRSLGYTREELIGRPVTDIEVGIPPQALRDLGQPGAGPRIAGAVTLRGAHRRKDGSTFPVELRVTALPVRADEPPQLLTLARDVSERERLQGQLLQAQKMESIGRLAGGVAHDFNNLLSTITGYCDLLLLDMPAGAAGREDVGQILEASERAAGLTRQLLAFSRRQMLELEVLDLARVLQDADRMLRRLIGDDIRVELRLPGTPAFVRADPVQMHQVILNLAVNARDAMPRGGNLVLEVAERTIDGETASMTEALAAGRFVALTVADDGEGMTPEVRSHIFEPFFTTKERGKGTGLGLATVYGIAQQHGGGIDVYSEPGQGTTVQFLLPLVEPAEARPPDAAAGAAPLRGCERVLVADDSEGVRRFLRDGLSRLGYQVRLAGDGTEALAWVRGHRDDVDLVLSDVVMPALNGHELMARLAEECPDLPGVLMSGYLEDHRAVRDALQRGTPLLRKPLTLLEVSRAIRAALERRQQNALRSGE